RLNESGCLLKSVQFQTGITVQFAPDSVSSFDRNAVQFAPGIGVQFQPEYAKNLPYRHMKQNRKRKLAINSPLSELRKQKKSRLKKLVRYWKSLNL
ncbi:MAG: hypothetical protein AB2794_15295, partial [Candidatus Thiodiazotropha endolucinida]